MDKESKLSKTVIRMYEDGWYVKEGVLYDNNNHSYKCLLNTSGYLVYCKHYGKEKANIGLHSLVAYQKFGDKIFDSENGKIHVRHIDGNKLNNLESNIEIGSQSDNMMDKPKEMRIHHAINASYVNRRFSDEDVRNIKIDRENGLSYADLCKKYNTCKSTLSFFFNHALYAKE